MGTAEFYDSLAATYHALYPDWERQLDDQAAALLAHLPPRRRLRIADVACGVGTQLLGLVRAGHDVLGSDLSPGAIDRARTELAERGLSARLEIADLRHLPWPDADVDAVICADNALPHLLEADDVAAAVAEVARVLRPGGTAVVTTRDYDRVLAERPSGTPTQEARDREGRRYLTFQVWSWRGDSDVYDLEHFQLVRDAAGAAGQGRDDPPWRTAVRSVTYRAYTRGHLSDLARRGGLVRPVWLTGEDTAYFQPLLVAERAR